MKFVEYPSNKSTIIKKSSLGHRRTSQRDIKENTIKGVWEVEKINEKR